LGDFQKIPFSCSKIGLKLLFEIHLKIEFEKHSFHLTGTRASHPAHWPKPPDPLGSASFPLARAWTVHRQAVTSLLQKDHMFVWTKECEAAFHTLRNC
jgi:hypothetical protein